jgi:hypothetical protein
MTNHAPIFASLKNIEVYEEELVELNVSVKDIDNDNIIITYSSPFNQEGKWQTKRGDKGNYSVNITISDGISKRSGKIEVTVLSINNPPVLDFISDITINENDLVEITVNATDSNNDTLFYSINDSRFTQNNNLFIWKTSKGDEGIYIIKVTITDGELNTSQEVRIKVLNPENSTDNPPQVTLISPSNNSIDTDGKIEFKCLASDDKKLTKVSFHLNNIFEDKLISGFSKEVIFSKTLNNGNYIWGCVVYDNNSQFKWSENHSLIVEIGENPPNSGVIVSPKNNVIYNSLYVNLNVFSNALSYEYSLDGGENITFTPNITLTGLSEGKHNLTVYFYGDGWEISDFVEFNVSIYGVSQNYSFREAIINEKGFFLEKSNISINDVDIAGYVCANLECSEISGILWDSEVLHIKDNITLKYPTELLSSYGYIIYSYKDKYFPSYTKLKHYGEKEVPPWKSSLSKMDNCIAEINNFNVETDNTKTIAKAEITSPRKTKWYVYVPDEVKPHQKIKVNVGLEITNNKLGEIVYRESREEILNYSEKKNVTFIVPQLFIGDYVAKVYTNCENEERCKESIISEQTKQLIGVSEGIYNISTSFTGK